MKYMMATKATHKLGDLSRKVAAVGTEARAAYERTDAFLDVIERGGIQRAPRDTGPHHHP